MERRAIKLPLSVQRMGGIALLATVLAAFPTLAWADDANEILKAMSQYLANQKNLSASFDSDIEVITTELQKIQFASSGHLEMSRPDKLHASRTGGYADVEIVFDGKTASVYGKNANGYIQVDAPGSVDEFFNRLSENWACSFRVRIFCPRTLTKC